jgi:ATP phosphoribosyltransferase regulatory subunit
MVNKNRWLLPEGVEEILPRQAWQIEEFRRKVLDLYRSWGYELVIPPLIEYSESLLIGMGSDMDLQSFKLTDQLSGRTLAIRADMTPQTARIDAHSWKQEGPTRLCYAGTVVHTKPKSQLASRTPIEVGAELYGDASVNSDTEIISLMLATIKTAGIQRVHLDLGHVGIYRTLVACAGITGDIEQALFDAFDRKAKTEINAIVAEHVPDAGLAKMIGALVDLNGDLSVLAEARSLLSTAPETVLDAVDYLADIAARIGQAFPDTPMYVDLAELRGYQYHTGLVFAAYIEGVGHAVANGGRYDGIGAAFGRARPATGFSANVKAFLSCSHDQPIAPLILAPASDDPALAALIATLRSEGQRVVMALPNSAAPANCTQQIINENGKWLTRPLS